VTTPQRQSGEYSRSLFEHAVVGLYRSTVEGRFLAVNPALVEMLGYASKAELLALNLPTDLYVRPEDRARLIERYRSVDRVDGVEVAWRRKDGAHITVRLTGRPVRGERDELEGFEMLAEDVTARRVLEDQLRQAQKMETVGQLTGGIAHDFNNVLTTILVNAEFLLHRHGQQDEESGLIEELQRAARRGAEMVRKLLLVSRSGPMALAAVDPRALLTQLAPMLRRLLPESIDVQVVTPAGLPPMRADAGALEQILLNLATNARDALPQGGVLRLEAARAWLDEEHLATYGWGQPGEYVSLAVSDSGAGMPQEVQARAFDPFFTTKAPGSGTGLGLAMVYSLMKQQEGFVHLYSEVGHGTTVKLYLAPSAEAVVGERPAATLELPRGTERVLVVEDDLSIRRATVRVLRQLGYHVEEAADGAQALAALATGGLAVDLVISDLVMPKIGGRDLYRRLRAEGLAMPLLIVSGYADAASRGEAELGPDVRFLHKPWTITEMAVRVRETLALGHLAGH
jgi:PAS domain S-box-containing protein